MAAAQLTAEESAMMADLLSGLDDALSDYTSTPVKTKTTTATHIPSSPLTAKHPTRKTPSKKKYKESPGDRQNRKSPLKPRQVQISPLRRRLLAKSPNAAKAKENQTFTLKPKGRTPKKQRDADAAALLAGLDDLWDWEADLADEATAPPKPKATPAAPQLPARLKYSTKVLSAPPKRYNPDPVTRCIVISVSELETGKYKREKHLIVRKDAGWKVKDDGERMLVVLKDDWILTSVVPGDVINVIGHFTEGSTSFSKVVSSIAVTALENTVVLHPDILITSTSVSSTSQCSRKPLISSLLHSPFNVTEATTWGSMLHEVMQECLAEGRWENTFVEEKLDKIVRSELDQLLRVNVGVEKAKVEVRARAVGIAGFSQKYIGTEPKPDATLIDSRANASTKATLALSGLHDIEEEIWSPTYGLKGKVDASVQALVKEGKSKTSQTMPFEIKTGKSTHGPEHRAQTMLYTLLMAERYLSEIPAGLLYYTQSESLIRVTPSRHELRGLIMSRNDTTSYLARRMAAAPSSSQEQRTTSADDAELDLPAGTVVNASAENPHFLPPTIDQEFTCRKCYAIDGCMLYRK
ncbi:Tripartite DNA replication factor, partial [Tulasnella sp. 417]